MFSYWRNCTVRRGTYLRIEKLLVGLELRRQTLVRVAEELGLVGDTLLEGFVDIRLHVVGMELAFRLLVLSKHVPHFALHAFLLAFQVAHNRVILLLPLLVVGLDFLLELLSNVTQLANLGSQCCLLFIDFLHDLLHDGSHFLHRLALLVVQLLLQLGNALDLVLNVRVPGNSLLLLKACKQLVHSFGTRLEDLLGAVKDCDFTLDFVENLLHGLELVVLCAQVGSVLPEVVALHVLAALIFGVRFFLIVHSFFKRHLFHF